MLTPDDVPYLDDDKQQEIVTAAAEAITAYPELAHQMYCATRHLDQAMQEATAGKDEIPDELAFDFEIQYLYWWVAAMHGCLVLERQHRLQMEHLLARGRN